MFSLSYDVYSDAMTDAQWSIFAVITSANDDSVNAELIVDFLRIS